MNVNDYPWSEPVIAAALVRQTFQRKCLVVVPNCMWTGHECDLLCVEPRLRIIDVEIKISRADLKADAKKDKWWRSLGYGGYRLSDGKYEPPPREPRTWPTKVWKHYYALPASIYRQELLDALPSPASGVIKLSAVRHHENSVPVVYAVVQRRAKPNPQADRLKPEQVADIARLATLRLWDALSTIEGMKRAT